MEVGWGKKGFSKDHRPDLNQMVIGAVIANNGKPICCEMWAGNTTDVKTLIPVTERMQERFKIGQCCIVADRGMISATTLKVLEDRKIPYILGTRMRKVKDVKLDVLSRAGRYREVYSEGRSSKDPAPLKVKEVRVNGVHYIIKKDPRGLVGNKGYRKYLTIERDSVTINFDKVKAEARFDGKWVLRTNTDLPPEQVALRCM